MKKICLMALFLSGCASVDFISNNDNAWVAIGSPANKTVFYCEKTRQDDITIPICTEASLIVEKLPRILYEQKIIKAIDTKKK